MPNQSLRPILDLEIPDLSVLDWIEVVRRALTRAREIESYRLNSPAITDQYHDDWELLRRFEYQHFYSSWVGMAFRLRACDFQAQTFTTIFQRTHGTAQNEDLYREDDALFDFFVKGLSALESFFYSLYALGALIWTPTHISSIPPPAQFPLLHPKEPQNLRKITPTKTQRTFEQVFPGEPLTVLLGNILSDEMYKQWSESRNILTHRVATAGRVIQYRSPLFFQADKLPLSVTQWASDFHLNAKMTASKYDWLKETINHGVEVTATFVRQKLAYTENELPPLV